jgi:pimeloyl-[acyl-carrier protein] methyl ester esterase
MTWVSLKDGARLRVRMSGAGTPILFVHGWAMNGALFADTAHLLGDGLTTICVDLRGHGESSRSGDASIEQLGADIAELVECLALRDVVVCGWSMGAMALWSAASDARFQRRVAGYVIVDMSPRLPNDGAWALGLADGRDLDATIEAASAMRADWAASVRRFAPRILAEGANQPVLRKRLEDVALMQDANLMASLWESMARQDFRARLRTLTAPTLAIFGEKSQLYREASSRFIARECPKGRAIGFRHSGHAPHLEEPQRFASVLREFVATTSRNSAPAEAGAAS